MATSVHAVVFLDCAFFPTALASFGATACQFFRAAGAMKKCEEKGANV